ncbi:hypothetical protein JW848_06150, partial [Candidatus Bipolaricaulota bacterium]|nr:hypothetical protein [Candidatus Bipolaricaulota bacterium]
VGLATSPLAPSWVSTHPAFAAWEGSLAVSSSVYLGFAGMTAASATVAVPGLQATFLQLDSGAIQAQGQGEVEGDGDTIRFLAQAGVINVALRADVLAVGVRAKGYAARQPSLGLGASLDVGMALATPQLALAVLVENGFSIPIAYGDGYVEHWTPRVCLLSAISIPLADNVSWGTAAELAFDESGLLAVLAGTEAWVGPLGLRAGYDGEAVSIGLSLRFPGYGFHVAYTLHDDLGATYIASLEIRFDGAEN